jgi:hypothetical protein
MLKKSLIAIAVLAMIVAPSFGATQNANTKYHGWPCQYVPQEIGKFKVTLKVGFYIYLGDDTAFEVVQNKTPKNYYGCKVTSVASNFNAEIKATVVPTSAAGGTWKIDRINVGADSPGAHQPFVGPTGGVKEKLTICVDATNVDISKLAADVKHTVALLTVLAVPNAQCDTCWD